MANKAKTEVATEKVPVDIDDVLGMLSNGKTREEIAAHYGLNRANMIRLFQEDELKGKKVKTPREKLNSFVVVRKGGNATAPKAEATKAASSDGTAPVEVAQPQAATAGNDNW